MASKALLLLLLCFFSFSSSVLGDFVKVSVKGVTTIAETDDNFVCATLDWWPKDKCDYGQCPWGNAGIFNLDLQNVILSNAIKAFNPLRIRIGGSLQDQIVYRVGHSVKKCPRMKKHNNGLFGFTKGCLTMKRWDALSRMFDKTSARVTFGLNALMGKKPANDGSITWVGDWDPRNARDFIKYTASKGYKMDSYELGNELCGSGVSARIEPDQYAKDLTLMRQAVEEIYPDPQNRPKILGPAGFFDKKWFKTFLQNTDPNVVDGVTHHIYNLGAGLDPDLINKVQDPYFLDQIAQTFKDAAAVTESFAPWSKPWVGESGGAYNSGGKTVSHTFADGFWFLDQLGMTATFNHQVYCRQALIGGNYALLNTTTFIPNPDYYSSLMWHRLMGKKVLSVSHDSSPYLRVYSHCAKNNNGGVTVLLINMAKSTTFDVNIVNDRNLYPGSNGGKLQPREEYHLTPNDGDIQSDVMLLNGTPLRLTRSLDIPDMSPILVDPTSAVSVSPHSYVFVTIKDFKASACA